MFDYQKIFELMHHEVINDGGDGDFTLALRTQNHSEVVRVANEFEVFLKEKDNFDIHWWKDMNWKIELFFTMMVNHL